jgi:hypothetical protein
MNKTAIRRAILATSSPATPAFSHERFDLKAEAAVQGNASEAHPQRIA